MKATYLTPKQVAELLSIHLQTAYRYMHEIGVERINGSSRIYVRQDRLEAHLCQNRSSSSDDAQTGAAIRSGTRGSTARRSRRAAATRQPQRSKRERLNELMHAPLCDPPPRSTKPVSRNSKKTETESSAAN